MFGATRAIYATGFTFVAALNHANNWSFVIAPAISSAMAAMKHLIHLHRRTLQLQTLIGQQSPNLAKHAPRCFVGDASLALNLLCGDSAASGTHEIHRIEPSLERSSALLKHGASERINVIAARLASVCCAIPHAMMLGFFGALLALRHTIRPALFFDEFKTRAIMWKVVIEITHGIAQLFGNTLFDFHNA